MERPATPTLDRLTELQPELNAIGEFMDWLHGKGYVLGGHQYHRVCKMCNYGDYDASCRCEEESAECWGMDEECPYEHQDYLWRVPIRDRATSIESLLSQYTGIDQNDVERERSAVLEYARSLSGA